MAMSVKLLAAAIPLYAINITLNLNRWAFNILIDQAGTIQIYHSTTIVKLGLAQPRALGCLPNLFVVS